MTEGSRVLVALRVPVSATRAFRVFTEQIGEWWRPNGLFQFTPGRTGTLAFEPGPAGRLVEHYPDGTSFVVGHVRAWEPPRRLVVSWREASFPPDQETELHVRFDTVGTGDTGGTGDSPGRGGTGDTVGDVETRVTVEHFGWDRLPQRHAARHGFPLGPFQLRLAEWWQALLAAFSEQVDRS